MAEDMGGRDKERHAEQALGDLKFHAGCLHPAGLVMHC